MTQWRLAAAWVLAAAVTTTLAWQIVSLADTRVGGATGAPLEVSGPSLSPTTTATGTPTTTLEGATSTSSSTTSTTSPGTPTTSPGSGGDLLTIPTVGGTVTVRVSEDSIVYLSAVPAPGFVVEVDDPGPPRVRVELISVATRVEVRVRWRDGEAEVRIDVD
jgi:hypothetical protein